MLVPCIDGRLDGAPAGTQALKWGSIIQAAWSFMLAARARGLGTAWTTLHLLEEQAVADILGIPHSVTQVALTPIAYYTGDDFKPAKRLDQHRRSTAHRHRDGVSMLFDNFLSDPEWANKFDCS